MKKILFNRQSPELQKLRDLIEKQNHRCLILWAIDCAPRFLDIFEESYGEDIRPREALNATIQWSKGEIKMPVARRAALDAHQAASDVKDDLSACAAAHAIGHVLGTVHVETHAMGFVMYGLTAFVQQGHSSQKDVIVKKEIQWFFDRLTYWESQADKLDRKWASFLLRNDVPNKEKILHEKELVQQSKI